MTAKTTKAATGHRSVRLNATPPRHPIRSSTKDSLIEVGERLFGLHGFDGISLREIASAAGQANTNAVQYHFGNKLGFISAIMDDRVKKTDTYRGELLLNLKKGSRNYARNILKALWMPTLAIRDAEGAHVFARFLLQVMLNLNMVLQPISRFYSVAKPLTGISDSDMSNTILTVDLIRDHFQYLPGEVLKQRLISINLMFLATVVEHDNSEREYHKKTPDFNIDPLLDMGLAVLKIPA